MSNAGHFHQVANSQAEVRIRLSSSKLARSSQNHSVGVNLQDHQRTQSPNRQAQLLPIKSKEARLKRLNRSARNASVDSCLYLIGDGDGCQTRRVDSIQPESKQSRALRLRRQFRSTQTLGHQTEALSYCKNSVGREVKHRERSAKRSQSRRESNSDGTNTLDKFQSDLDDGAKFLHATDLTQSSTLSILSHKSTLTSEMSHFVTRSPRSGTKRASVSDPPSTSSLNTTTSIGSATNSQCYSNQATNSNGQQNTGHIHRGQYSSSQALLQSLTPNDFEQCNLNNSNATHQIRNLSESSPSSANYTNSSLESSSASATPISHSTQAAPPMGRQFHFRSQQQLFSIPSNGGGGTTQMSGMTNGDSANTSSSNLQNNSTKPMTSSMTPQNQLEATNSAAPSSPAIHLSRGQQRLNSMPFKTSSINSPIQQATASSYMRPQIATTSHQFVDQHQGAQLPPPYSSVVGQVSGGEQQQQSSGQLPSGVRHQSSALPTMMPIGQPQARSIFNFPPNCQPNQQQQQVAPSSTASQEPVSACREQTASPQQQANIVPGQQPQQQPLHTNAAAAILSNGNYQLLNGRAQQLMAGAGFKKSKSCLACADISIKWYIVVIALLGLICALIGTIVGAVHSVGRDYISLSLLLLGVGLVLIAISWIALRIAINTYKSTSANPLGPLPTNTRSTLTTNSLGQGLNSCGSLILNSPTHQQQPPSRLHGHRNHHHFLISQQQQQALINERLYMMAAAAANSNMQRSLGSVSRPDSSQANQTSHRARSILRSIKQRIPRCLIKLISSTATSGTENGSIQSHTSSEHSPPVTNYQPSDHDQLQTGASTLATLLQQYRMLPANHQGPLMFTPNGLAPPLHPPPIHLLAASVGHVGLGPHVHDSILRPPPPSYNAAMQDQRIRMIMQERVTLQQLQRNSLGTSVRQSAIVPPPPSPSISEPRTDEISQNDHAPSRSAPTDSTHSSGSTERSRSSIKRNATTQRLDNSCLQSNCDKKSRLVPFEPEGDLAQDTRGAPRSQMATTLTVASGKTVRTHSPTVINIGENVTTVSSISQANTH